MNIESKIELAWTGERFIPGMQGSIRTEHLHRYLMAKDFVKEKTVLDIASGEGYGTAILGVSAHQAIGVDISGECITYANETYKNEKVRFLQGDCMAIPLPNTSIDVVVSFETLEHITEQDAMMAEISRVLTKNGLLIISTPEKRIYADIPKHDNPFHMKELYKAEFIQLIAKYFSNFQIFGQRVIQASLITTINAQSSNKKLKQYNHEMNDSYGLEEPMYLICFATKGKLPTIHHSYFLE